MKPIAEARMDDGVAQGLVHALRSRLPFEACGVITGTAASGGIEASGFRLIRNAADQPTTRFSFHPEDWIAAFFEAQKNQREIVGFFHSHPSGTIVPSKSDLAGFIPWKTYWIVGLSEGDYEIGVFLRQPGERWAKLPLRIVNAGLSKRTALPESSLAGPKSASET